MKNYITPILCLTGLSLVSCTTPLRPSQNVENVERQAPTTPTPNVGQHHAGQNAVDYANDRSYYRGYRGYRDGYRGSRY